MLKCLRMKWQTNVICNVTSCRRDMCIVLCIMTIKINNFLTLLGCHATFDPDYGWINFTLHLLFDCLLLRNKKKNVLLNHLTWSPFIWLGPPTTTKKAQFIIRGFHKVSVLFKLSLTYSFLYKIDNIFFLQIPYINKISHIVHYLFPEPLDTAVFTWK